MKKIFNLLFVISITLCFLSCEDNINESKNFDLGSSKVSIKDGRLYFPSKQLFEDYFKKYADAPDQKLSEFFTPLYEKGFYSLRPIVTAENEKLVYDNYIKTIKSTTLYKSTSKTDDDSDNSDDSDDPFAYFDDIDDIIGDDVFAAFLNQKGEIQIEDIIYKYTDVGLFFAKSDKLDALKNFLQLRNISDDMMIKTEDIAKTQLLNDYPQSGTVEINGDISYYKLIPPNTDADGNPYTGVGDGPSYNPNPYNSDTSYLSFLNGLQSCSPSHGLFGTLFGDNDVCIDRYERRRRVKTKAFNYNYLLVYHMGVKVVHQYRGWTFLWRGEDTDEIRLVVEAAQFEYDVNSPMSNAIINNATAERAYYLNNQKILYQPNAIIFQNQWGTPLISYLDMNSLPQVFQNDLTFEFFGTGWSWLDDQIQNGIDSNLKASKLNDYFYHELYNTAKNQIESAISNYTYNPPSNRTFLAKFPDNGKMIIQKSVKTVNYNTDNSQQTFDWGAEFSMDFSDNANGSCWSISNVGPGNQLIRPANLRIKIIGAARHGTDWHGSKFNDGID